MRLAAMRLAAMRLAAMRLAPLQNVQRSGPVHDLNMIVFLVVFMMRWISMCFVRLHEVDDSITIKNMVNIEA